MLVYNKILGAWKYSQERIQRYLLSGVLWKIKVIQWAGAPITKPYRISLCLLFLNKIPDCWSAIWPFFCTTLVCFDIDRPFRAFWPIVHHAHNFMGLILRRIHHHWLWARGAMFASKLGELYWIYGTSPFLIFHFCNGDWGVIVIIEEIIWGAKKTQSAIREIACL